MHDCLRMPGRIITSLLVMLLLAGGLSLALWDFGQQASSGTRANAYMWLRQSAEQCAETFRSRIDEKFTALEIIADYFATLDSLTDEHALRFVSVATRQQSIRRVSVITSEGVAYSADGAKIDAANRSYFLRAMRGERVISRLLHSRFDGNKVFILSVPIKRNGDAVGVVSGSFLAAELHNSININSLEGSGFLYILEKDGNVVLKSERSPLPVKDHFFDLAQTGDSASLLRLKEGMAAGHSGTLRCAFPKASFYVSYVPLGINDWYVLSMVPEKAIDSLLNRHNELAALLSAKLAVLFLGVFIYIYYVRHKDRRQLQKKHQELQLLTDNISGGVLKSDTDAEFTLEYMSPGYLDIMEYSREDFRVRFGDRLLQTVIAEDRPRIVEAIHQQMQCGETLQLEYRSRTATGRIVWFYYKGHLVREDDRRWCYAIAFDATRQQELVAREKLANERYHFIMDQHAIVVFDWDIGADNLSASAGWLTLFGKETSLFREGSEFFSHVHPVDRNGLERLFRTLSQGEIKGAYEARMAFSSDRYDWYRVEASTLFDQSGNPTHVMGLLLDINREKKLELSLRDRADRDSATGLYNKEATQRLVESLLSGEGENKDCSLMIIDLDNFKQVNDTQGHEAGDTVILQVAELLKKRFRNADIVGRIGGDEFAVCLSGLKSRRILADKAGDVLRDIETVFKTFPLEISVSIGIALCPEDDTAFIGLYRKADVALYQSKNRGKNCFSFYGDSGRSV